MLRRLFAWFRRWQQTRRDAWDDGDEPRAGPGPEDKRRNDDAEAASQAINNILFFN